MRERGVGATDQGQDWRRMEENGRGQHAARTTQLHAADLRALVVWEGKEAVMVCGDWTQLRRRQSLFGSGIMQAG